MLHEAGSARRWLLWCAPLFALLSVGVVVGGPLAVGLNMADEGFLWYGVQRTVAGEVAMRDFQAYDPGRYLWCALLAPLVGDGILGVRVATALFGALGVTLALHACGRFARHAGELLLCALLLALWLFPRHKLFEPALASAALWFAVRMLEDPSARAHLASGAFVGLCAFFGRNHALYAGLALGLCALYLAWKLPELRTLRRAGAFALGVALGLVPLLGMLLFVPGFAAGYWRSLRLVLEHGANLALPYPFPWRTDWSALAGWELARELARAVAFLLPFVVLPLGLVLLVRTTGARVRERAVALAAFLVGALYVHHVTVRSDAPHLAQCFPPLLLAALALPGELRWKRARTLAWGALVVLSVLSALQGNSALARLRPGARGELAACEVAGEELRLLPGQATQLRVLQEFVAAKLPGDEPLWIVNQPTLYPVLGKVAPSWWLFFYWPESEEEQRAHVRRLEERGVNWALVNAGKIEGPGESGFPDTHPLVWKHLQTAFQPVNLPALPRGMQLLRRRK